MIYFYSIKIGMKIAILFSGRIHLFQKSYQNIIKNMVQGNEVDFFVSYPKNTDINETNAFLEKFEPKGFMESEEEYFSIEKYPDPPKHVILKSRHNMMCMFLNRKNVFQLLQKYIEENNIKYDLVISTRIDFLIHQKLDLKLLIHKANQEFLCIPAGQDCLGLNDRIAMGNMDTMNVYMSCFDSLEYLFENGTWIHPESALKDYVQYKQMKVFRFPLKTEIIR